MSTPVPLREAAALLGVSRQHVSRLAASGELHPSVAPCGCRLFDVGEILARRHAPPDAGRPRKHEIPGQLGASQPLTIDLEPSEVGPWGPQEALLIMIEKPVTVVAGGRVRDQLSVGRCMSEAPLARQLVRAGFAVWAES